MGCQLQSKLTDHRSITSSFLHILFFVYLRYLLETMPRIMLQNKMMLAQSKSSLGGSSRRGSSSWSPKSSTNVRMALERRQSLERSQRDLSQRDESSSSDESPEDWGFFVDIGAVVEERAVERTFLHGFNHSTRRSSKLGTIADSGF